MFCRPRSLESGLADRNVPVNGLTTSQLEDAILGLAPFWGLEVSASDILEQDLQHKV